MVGTLLSAGLLAFLLWRVDLGAVAEQLARTRWEWALASAVFAVANVWARARRWRYLYPPGSNPPALFRAAMIGYMANNVLPLRAGEIVRVYVVARHWSQGFWLPLATLVVERVLDALVVVLILGGLLFIVPLPAALRWTAAAFLALDAAAVVVLVAIATAPDACRQVITRLTANWSSLERKLIGGFEMFARGLVGVRTPVHVGPIVAWSAIVWLLAALMAWTALLAARLHLPFVAAWTVVAFVGLGISLPSAPGYVGVFHAAAVLALAVFSVPEAAALGYAVVYHACGFIPVTLFGWILLLREQMSLGIALRGAAAVGAAAEGEATHDKPSRAGNDCASR